MFDIKWIGLDSFFGRDIDFLESLPEHVYFFANIPCNTQVWLEKPTCHVPSYSGRGRKPTRLQLVVPESKPLTVEQVAALRKIAWKKAAVIRWSIEQSIKIGKSELGMADYECRP